MEFVVITLALLCFWLLRDNENLKGKLREKDNVLKVREVRIEELKDKLDYAHAELIKYIRPRGAGGKFKRKA